MKKKNKQELENLKDNEKKSEMEFISPRIKYPHGVPRTRRELLKAGLIQFSAAITLPSIYQLLMKSEEAHGLDLVCGGQQNVSSMAVFVQLSLAGGAAMGSNFVPHDAGGQLLPSYNVLGLGASGNLNITREFANKAPFAGNNVSGMINGIRTGAKPATLQNAVFAGIPVRSQDDSTMNKFDITGAVDRAGLKGISLPSLGTVNSPTGGRHQPAYIQPPAPLIVSSYTDLANAINVAGSLATLNSKQKVGLFRMVNRLTVAQERTLASMSGGSQVAALTACASLTNQTLVSTGTTGTSPLENPALATVWNINNNSDPGSQNFVFAAMMYNALKGNAGSVNLTMGGYDYHGNARTNTNASDTAAGLAIGRILESAAVMGKKVFLCVTSDGGVGSTLSDSSAVNFSSDRGSGGVAYMIAYNPTKPPSASGFQVGQMTPGQAADDKFITGDSPELAAAAMLANYMSFNGKLGLFENIVSRVFTPEQLNQVVKIAE
ncbi:MAG: hypothetical protein K1X29_07315 [Bdellovibrionales bacterium]|nr:hypothetical protein [Bdellovibrionales bacterium]